MSLYTYLAEYASVHPDRPMIGDQKGWITASEMVNQVNTYARELRLSGISKHDLVAVSAFRDVETALRLLALQLIGAVAVLTSPRNNPMDELRECDVHIPVNGLLEHGVYTRLIHSDPSEEVPNIADQGFVIFTSGSTGRKKAVMLSQENLISNLVDSYPLGFYHEDDIALGALPIEHVFGLVLLAGVCVLGYAIYFPEKTDIQAILDTIETQRITRMNGVPSLYLAMASQADRYDLSSLRAGFIGGGPFTQEQFYLIEQRLGMLLIPVYGMSECIGIACASWKDPKEIRACGSAPFYSRNSGIIRREDGACASTGEIGEIWVNGPARMVGYYPNRMPEGEMLPTGDLGFLDEFGRLHLTGRKKDIIIRNGNNISARRIEEAILSIPGVEDAAVVALPHPIQGEIPGAMVCGNRTRTEILAILTTVLAKNEIPAEIQIVAQLPRTPSGKTDKQTIREVLQIWKA